MADAPEPLLLEDLPGGPPAGSLLCDFTAFDDDGVAALHYKDGAAETHLIVVIQKGEYRAFDNRCPHAATKLNEFADSVWDRKGKLLMCHTHGALFRPEDGWCKRGPCRGQYLRTVAIEVREDGLYSL